MKANEEATVNIVSSWQFTWSNMDAFAQRMLPGTGRALAGLTWVPKFLVELTATITSSTPSQPNTDHPSSLKPLMASLKPLQKKKNEIVYT